MTTVQLNRIIGWIWAASLAIAVALMLRPLPDLANDLTSVYPQSDLAFHFITFVYLRFLPHATTWGRTRAVVIAIGLVAFGVALEFAQSLTGTRTACWEDAVANTAGVIAGSWLCPLVQEVQGKHDR